MTIMKKILFILIILAACINVFSQTPERFSYQVIVRDETGAPRAEQNITLFLSIVKSSVEGVAVYSEKHSIKTNMFGLVNIAVGSGMESTGDFTAIDWGADTYFLKVEIDPAGGTNYTEMGTTQLLSVPYALQAKTAANYSEADPVFVMHPANGITSGLIDDWNNAYLWGNHADAGYLKSFTETDPVFSATPASDITPDQIANWNNAYLWGNHADAGYLKSFTETDPVFSSTPASGITSGLIENWNNAYLWGNHAEAGYLKSFTEADPVFSATPASGITPGQIANWDNAYSWGNHADAGYLTSFSETDPKVGVIAQGYLPTWNGSSLVTGAIYQDESGNIGIGTESPNAAVDIVSTTGGLLIPRMTTEERDLISSPATGLQIYNITTNCFNIWNGSSWGQVCPDCSFKPAPGNNGPICAGLTLDLTVETIPGATYSWTGPDGFSSNLQNPSILSATTAASGAYFVTVTLNGCTSQPIATVATVNPSLGPTSASYNNPLCVNNTLTFNATTIPGASYTWSGPNNYFSNIQNPSIPNVQLSQAGTYYVVATQGSCSSSSSVEVIVLPVPAKPGTITGTSALLPPQTNVAYSVAPVSGAASYTWTYTGAGATINGQGSNSVTIDFACGSTGGNLAVTANNICGGASVPQTQSVMMNTLAQPGTVSGTSPVILPQSGIIYSIAEVSGATSYTWTVPVNLGNIVSGQGTTSITVDFACGATGGVISVVADNTCGSSVARTFPVSIASLATPGTISGSGTITYPQTGVAYSVPAVPGATTYTWTVPSGASITSGQGSNSILVDYACGASSGNVSVTASNSCGSGGTNSMSVTVTTGTPATPGAISGTNTLPAGVNGVTYSISPVSGATSYTWTVPDGASISLGQGTTSIIVNYSCSAVSGNVTVTASNGCGTSGARTFAITVISAPSQPGTITGLSSVPQGATGITYSVATVTGATSYNWSYSGSGATITSGQGTNSITVAFECGSTNGNIIVNASNSCGVASSDRTLAVTITGTIATPGAITGTSAPLFGQTATPYSVAYVNGATNYNWTVPSGANIVSGQGTNFVLVDFSCSAVAGNISVTVNNSCIGAGSASNLAITPGSTVPQPGTITGTASVPQGQTGIVYSIAPVTGATTYNWTYTGTGATFASGQGTTSVSVDYSCTASSGNISVTASNSCIGPGVARTFAVTVNSLSTPGTITGTASLPKGSTGISYSITPVSGATSYTWIPPLNSTVVFGQGTSSVLVDFGCTASSGNILVTANNACGSSGGSSLNITLGTGAPATPGGITTIPTTTIPKGTYGVNHSIAAVTGAASYTWSVPPGAVIISGQGTTSITADYPCSAGSGNVSVVANNACGSSSATTQAMTITTAPATPGGITGSTSVQKGSTGVSYSIAAVTGATNYTWSVPTGATITLGQGTTAITVDFTNFTCSATPVSITVNTSNSCGNISANSSLAVTVNTSLGTLGTITGTTSPYYGQTGTPYSVAAITGATTYTWSVPEGATISSGQGTTNIGVDFSCSAVNGTIVVSASNACSSTSPVSLSYALSSAALAQPGTITGPASVPKGTTSATYSIAAVTGATSYSWTVPANAVITSGQGTTSINVDFSDCSVASGSVSVTATNSCVAVSPARTLAVTVTTTALATPGTIVGLQTPVAGQSSVQYSVVSVSGATSYTWSYSGTGATITSGQGTTTITVDYSCGTTPGNLNVTASNGCVATSAAQSLSISPVSTLSTPGTIIGIQTPAYGQSGVQYTVGFVPSATTYTWSVGDGVSITSGQGTNSICVNFSCTAATNGTITVTAGNGCSQTSPASALSYVMGGSLSTPGTIGGLSSVPKGITDAVYSVSPVPGATSYTWSVPGGCSITSGQGTNSIKVDFGCTASSGNISVTATNSCTTTNASSLAVTVTSTLANPGSITGTASPYFGSAYKYYIAPVTGATSYNWSSPSGAIIESGSGTNSVWYNFGCGAVSGNISVTVSNACISPATSSNLAVTPTSSETISTLGAITETINAGLINSRTYSVVPVGAAVYTWTVPGGMIILSGQGGPSITVNYTGSVTGAISVTASNSCLSQSSTSDLAVNITNSVTYIPTGTGQNGYIQSFTVPEGVTSINIETWGAQGGSNSYGTGGKGARMKGTFTVTPGQILKILVGQQGVLGGYNGGGGGGTFITDSYYQPMIIAGGGGGSTYPNSNGADATTSTNGTPGVNGGSAGGSGGSGGAAIIYSAGGGGFSGNGSYYSSYPTTSGISFLNGGRGGYYGSPFGGYGGGGVGISGGGGGGGYSGGGGGAYNLAGGGGGSYNAGSNQDNSPGVKTGDGKVVITW